MCAIIDCTANTLKTLFETTKIVLSVKILDKFTYIHVGVGENSADFIKIKLTNCQLVAILFGPVLDCCEGRFLDPQSSLISLGIVVEYLETNYLVFSFIAISYQQSSTICYSKGRNPR